MRPWRIVLVAVGALVALNLLGALIDAASGGRPSGPRGSSYATSSGGVAALHDLLERSGHPVSRLRRRGEPDPRTTVFVLDPEDLTASESRALRRFVERGGRLVASRGVLDDETPEWRTAGVRAARPIGSGVDGVREVKAAGKGSWRPARRWSPVLGGGGRTLLVTAAVGRGRVYLLADSSPLSNAFLAQADNAALGAALAGPDGRRVAFAETVHGYGQARGLAALPDRWKWVLVGLLLAALVWIASRIRRLGPVEEESRPLPPPRRAYVDAVGAALARAGRPAESAERVRVAARARVARRAGLGADPPDDRVAAAAATLGLTEEEAAALTRPARDDDGDLLLAGRALARSGGGGG